MSQADLLDQDPVFQLKGSMLAITVLELAHNDLERLDRQLAEKVKAGDYQVSVSSIGYKTSVVSVLGLSQPIDLGTISLASSSISLDEVTVNASAIRNTADRKIAFPTSEQKAASSNGINLLNALMLPRLEVDPIRNSVSLPNEGTIQFCINGIKEVAQDPVFHGVVQQQPIGSLEEKAQQMRATSSLLQDEAPQ